jgi:predicted peroxiredoxin
MGAAYAQEEKSTLIFNLTTDDVWNNQMALGLAERVLDMDYPVVVFLNVRAVVLANKNIPQHTGGLSGKTPHDMLKLLMEKGAQVYVCPTCTEQAGLSLDDRLEGIKPGSKELIKLIMAPTSKIMNY